MVEKIVESPISRVGQVVDETRRAREVAEATIAEANAAHAVEVLSGCVQEVAEHSQAQTSRVAEAVAQQLEKEIEAAATSTAATAEIQTRTAVEGMRRDVQVQLDQNRVDIQRKDAENQKTMQQIVAGLKNLTKQLNNFRLVNVEHVGDVQQQVSENFDQRLNLQSSRIDVVAEAVQKAQKIAEENAEFLQGSACGC